MILERIKSDGLSHNSYLVGSHGNAVLVDPRRDCQVYLDSAYRHGLKINSIFETHRNEDYATGSVELSKRSGAGIYHGPGLDWRFGATLQDGQEFQVGDLLLTAIHTPGHTGESMTYAVSDTGSGPAKVLAFTGDALFVDDVGRVDLPGPAHTERLARALFQSLHERILPLGDGAILCPAHGGGSVCGGNISDRDESSLGVERSQNRMLKLSEEDFVSEKIGERLHRPPYFATMERYNLDGPPVLGHLPVPARLSAKDFQQRMERGAVVVDTRLPADFCGAHISGSYSIWLSGVPQFAGWVLPYDRPILLVLEDESRLDNAVRYLVRLGYDKIEGHLWNGMEGWYNSGMAIQGLAALSVHQLRAMMAQRERLTILDVRGETEWSAGHIEGSVNIYVGHLDRSLSQVPKDGPVAVLCNVGRRASLGASILQRAGYPTVYNVLGSMTAWRASGYPVVTG